MSIVKSMVFLGLISPLMATAAAAENTSPATSSQPFSQPVNIYRDALSYLLGRNGRPRSAEKAAALFKSLAEQNWSAAQHMLGNLYYRGQGVEKNDLLAYKWLSIAARNNVRLARAIHEKRQRLQSRLSTEHLQQVEQWIANWEPDRSLALGH